MEGKKKILVVDDNSQAVEMLTMILEDNGFNVIKAYEGESGLLKTREQKPDLIILDIRLPDIDGFQVCEEIKNDPDVFHIPVVMLTGKDKGDDFDKAMNKKADWYIIKPYDVGHLLKVVDKLLG